MMPAYRFIIAVITPLVKLLYPHRVIGAENIPDGAAVVCGNHSSYIDPVLIAVAFTSRRMVHFMGKAEIFKNPFFRWFFTKIGAFPVRRGEQDIAAIKNSMRFLKEGTKVMIFPEGTRSKKGNDMLEFHSGSFKCALKSKCPVIPIALVDCFKVLDQKGSKPVSIQLHYLEPILYEEYKDMNTTQLANLVKERIQKKINESL